MIVYEKADSFIMINQHDHAKLSGDLASMWREDLMIGPERKDDLVYAAYQHDRGWIDLDGSPFWNDAKKIPYSFRDFPLQPRFPHYVQGIDEVQQQSEYSALLCSMLYTTLFERINNEKATPYLNHEYARQIMLKTRLQIEDEAALQQQLKILLICDELSLFMCMEEPGTPTEQYELFAKGLHYSLDVKNADSDKKDVHWVNEDTLQLSFFPFQMDVDIVLPYKEVHKADIALRGIIKAYREASPKVFNFLIKA